MDENNYIVIILCFQDTLCICNLLNLLHTVLLYCIIWLCPDILRISGACAYSYRCTMLPCQELTTAPILFSVFRKLQKAQPHWAYVDYTKVLLQYITVILYNVHCMLYCVIAGPELTCLPRLGSRLLALSCSSSPEPVDFATCSYDNLPAFQCKQTAIV